MITENEKQRLLKRLDEWFDDPKAPKPTNKDSFKESALNVFIRNEERYFNQQICANALDEALKKINQIIEKLDDTHNRGFGNKQTELLEQLLRQAKEAAGSPKDKAEIHKAYYNSKTETWIQSTLLEQDKKQRSKDSGRLIFDLEALWFSEFGQRPSANNEHPFYVFAYYLTEIDAGSIRKKRGRTTAPKT